MEPLGSTSISRLPNIVVWAEKFKWEDESFNLTFYPNFEKKLLLPFIKKYPEYSKKHWMILLKILHFEWSAFLRIEWIFLMENSRIFNKKESLAFVFIFIFQQIPKSS
jgi:hypothetical protein